MLKILENCNEIASNAEEGWPPQSSTIILKNKTIVDVYHEYIYS